MTKFQTTSIVLLRLALGWLFLYSGITKIMDSSWSAAGFLNNASTLSGFYYWLASPSMLPITNFVNEWGQLLLGASLILGLFVRLSSGLGALLMILYYLAVLKFPYPNTHSYVVDDHIVYALVLLLFAAFRAGRIWGLDRTLAMQFQKYPTLGKLLG